MSSETPESKKKISSEEELGDLFLLFRRKVQESELLSAATEKIVRGIGFTGRLTVVVQNGEVLKSGYEEGYFRRKDD
jgi:hypothetical protein